jgi:WD40 repeat protein
MMRNQVDLSRIVLEKDQRNFKKLRKTIRQIEHLQLLKRPLNEEEKIKVSKRAIYREQLSTLNAKYLNNSDLLKGSFETSMNSDAHGELILDEECESSTNLIDQQASDDAQDEASTECHQSIEKNSSFEKNMNDISAQLSTILVDADDEERATNKSEKKNIFSILEQSDFEKNAKNNRKEQQLTDSKKANKVDMKKQQQQNASKKKIVYKSKEFSDLHEDLIVSVDICVEHRLILTASRDTTIKAWKIEEENNKTIRLIHSFGGHTSSITLVRFWPLESYIKCLRNLSASDIDSNDADG